MMKIKNSIVLVFLRLCFKVDNFLISLGFKMEIPELINTNGETHAHLPPGVHRVTLAVVKKKFATGPKRKKQFNGFVKAAKIFRKSGCKFLYLNGSYVTEKKKPRDYDVCWNESEVDLNKLPGILRPVQNITIQKQNRKQQKLEYEGEFISFLKFEPKKQPPILNIFQQTRKGNRKGIIKICVACDPFLK